MTTKTAIVDRDGFCLTKTVQNKALFNIEPNATQGVEKYFND